MTSGSIIGRSMQPRATAPSGTPIGPPSGLIRADAIVPDAHLPRPLFGPDRVMPALLDAVAGAEEVVNASVFALQPRGTGEALAEAMIERHRNGVEANLVLDMVGSTYVPGLSSWRNIRQLRKAGLNVIMTRPLTGNPALKYVDHRKIVTVDGKIAYVGSMNFGEMFEGWHDAMVELHGANAHDAAERFLERWRDIGGQVTPRHLATLDRAQRDLAVIDETVGGRAQSVWLLENSPVVGNQSITEFHRDAIAGAQHRVWAGSPVLGDASLVDALAGAAYAGRDVRVVTSGGNLLPPPIPIVQTLTRTHYGTLLDAGVQVIESDGTNHVKALLIDDHLVTLGSYNLTRRSAAHDHELNVVAHGGAMVDEVERFFNEMSARGRTFTHADIDSIGRRMLATMRRAVRFNY